MYEDTEMVRVRPWRRVFMMVHGYWIMNGDMYSLRDQ